MKAKNLLKEKKFETDQGLDVVLFEDIEKLITIAFLEGQIDKCSAANIANRLREKLEKILNE